MQDYSNSTLTLGTIIGMPLGTREKQARKKMQN